jgi:hypothetical protein
MRQRRACTELSRRQLLDAHADSRTCNCGVRQNPRRPHCQSNGVWYSLCHTPPSMTYSMSARGLAIAYGERPGPHGLWERPWERPWERRRRHAARRQRRPSRTPHAKNRVAARMGRSRACGPLPRPCPSRHSPRAHRSAAIAHAMATHERGASPACRARRGAAPARPARSARIARAIALARMAAGHRLRA